MKSPVLTHILTCFIYSPFLSKTHLVDSNRYTKFYFEGSKVDINCKMYLFFKVSNI